MRNVAEKIESLEPVLEYCLVADEKEGLWTVAAESGRYAAKTAMSCLVRPEKGDIVLVSIDHQGGCYILSILERPDREKRPATLSFEGQVNLDARSLNVFAHDGIAFTTPESIAMTSGDLEINALKGKASIEDFSFLGKIFDGRMRKIRVIADAVDSTVRRAAQRFVSSYRYIEEHEEIQSASTRLTVDGALVMQTRNTVHTAEEHIKIDAGQIHLG